MNNREDIKERISNVPQDRISNIIFEKKKSTRSRVKLGVKIILYLAIAGILSSVISNIIIKNKSLLKMSILREM